MGPAPVELGVNTSVNHEPSGPFPKGEMSISTPRLDGGVEEQRPESVSTRRSLRKTEPAAKAVRKQKKPGAGGELMGDEAEPPQAKQSRKRRRADR